MGIDYKNLIMYGKEFDSLQGAVQELLFDGKITEDQAEEIIDCGELFWDDTEDILNAISLQIYSYYTGGKGVLGLEFSAKEIYTDPVKTKEWTDKMDAFMSGCTWHEFVQVY